MFLAPYISGAGQLRGTLLSMSDGVRGIYETIGAMRQLVNAYKTDLEIRQAAASAAFLTAEKDELAEVEAVFNFVRDHIRYLKDVHGVETLATPDKTLMLQYGDCDDQVTLLASMLESIGYPTRFVITGYSDPRIFEHVYMQVLVGNHWIDLDPTEPHDMGYAPPDPVVIHVEAV